MALFGGGLLRLVRQRKEAGFPLIKRWVLGAQERLLGNGEAKGILKSKGALGGLGGVVFGLMFAFGLPLTMLGVDLDTSGLAPWQRVLIGTIVAILSGISYVGRNMADKPLAGSDAAEKRRKK